MTQRCSTMAPASSVAVALLPALWLDAGGRAPLAGRRGSCWNVCFHLRPDAKSTMRVLLIGNDVAELRPLVEGAGLEIVTQPGRAEAAICFGGDGLCLYCLFCVIRRTANQRGDGAHSL